LFVAFDWTSGSVLIQGGHVVQMRIQEMNSDKDISRTFNKMNEVKISLMRTSIKPSMKISNQGMFYLTSTHARSRFFLSFYVYCIKIPVRCSKNESNRWETDMVMSYSLRDTEIRWVMIVRCHVNFFRLFKKQFEDLSLVHQSTCEPCFTDNRVLCSLVPRTSSGRRQSPFGRQSFPDNQKRACRPESDYTWNVIA